jgi:hypothetical protein
MPSVLSLAELRDRFEPVMRGLFRKSVIPGVSTAQGGTSDFPADQGETVTECPVLLIDNDVDSSSTDQSAPSVRAEDEASGEQPEQNQVAESDVEWVHTEYMSKNSIFTYFAEHGLGVKAFNDNWNSVATGADFQTGHPVYVNLVVQSLVKLSTSGDSPSFRKWYSRLHDVWLDLKQTVVEQGA